MDARILRGGFRLAFFIVAAALVTLPFQSPGSAEFVVTVLAAVVGLLFAVGVIVLSRLGGPPLPDDKARSTRYNVRSKPKGR